MTERPPNWTCPGPAAGDQDEPRPHTLTGFAKRYGFWCQSCAIRVARGLAAKEALGASPIVYALLDALDQAEKNWRDEAREAGREIQALAADLRDAESRAERADW